MDLIRQWCEPNEEIIAAQNKFRELMRDDKEKGLLRQEDMMPQSWFEMKLFVEKPQAFEDYIAMKANVRTSLFRDFINKMSKYKEIVVFCTGKAASSALCVMQMNGIKSIKAFCDNNKEKWGSDFGGYNVISPQEAVLKYPNAYFLIASRKYSIAILKQLKEMNISEDNISVYRLPIDPIESTNIIANAK